ncbi:hypothetical protein SLS58_000446 [Diplodia intermedia]|uniref:Xylanolytic transcriptional activator regulatory domain-containing protein n=1 Tax=Diplodia intermedia TaxID=856260 RepID=A0ABR3U6E3_9PEZI
MSEPPRIDPALEFGGQQPERSDQDFKQRLQGLQDSFYAHNAFYGPYPPQAQTASQAPALQAIATAAQDRRPSTPSSASVGAADPNSQSLQVRCDPQEENGVISEAIPCKRCLKSKKVCVTTAPTKKRTKKADTRVAELEKKVNELTARLGDNAVASYAYETHPPLPDGAQSIEYADSTRPEKRRRMNDQHDALMSNEARREIMYDEHAEIAAAAHQRVENRPPQPDCSYISYEVDRCISPDVADRIVSRYINALMPAFPAVPLPQETTAQHLREEKPLLFLSVLSAASFGCDPLVPAEAQRYLADLLQSWFAELIWRRQDKSLEIVQALLVCVLWYRPPVVYERHAFYMMTNAAITMVLELGLGKRAGKAKAKLGLGPFRKCLPNAGGMDARRSFMVCYYLGTNIAMVLRRPMLLRWNQYMDECISELESSDGIPSDKFSMDDPVASANFSEKYNEIALRNYDTKLELLRPQRPSNADQNATFPGDLGSVITPDSLRLEHYFDNLIRRFQNTEERDPQSPHTKFPRILLRLREKFNRMKNGESCGDVFSGQPPASASGTSAPAATNSAANGAHEQARQTFPANGNNVATTQTPLHLLSEVAQQAQAPPLQQGYYDNGMGGQAVNNYNWDMAPFGDFDFSSMGMGVDLASLFGGDMGGYEPQPAPPQYGPHQAAPAPIYPEPSSWNA